MSIDRMLREVACMSWGGTMRKRPPPNPEWYFWYHLMGGLFLLINHTVCFGAWQDKSEALDLFVGALNLCFASLLVFRTFEVRPVERGLNWATLVLAFILVFFGLRMIF